MLLIKFLQKKLNLERTMFLRKYTSNDLINILMSSGNSQLFLKIIVCMYVCITIIVIILCISILILNYIIQLLFIKIYCELDILFVFIIQ